MPTVADDTSRFTLTLSRDPDTSEIQVLSAELMGDGFKQRATFPGRTEIQEVLSGEMINFIVKLLKRPGPEQRLITHPETYTQFSGLLLGRVRVFFRAVVDDYDSAVVRFSHCVGDLNAAFQRNVFFVGDTDFRSEKIATEALESICLPILDIISPSHEHGLPKEAQEEMMKQRMQRIDARCDELRYHINRLKHYANLLIEQQEARKKTLMVSDMREEDAARRAYLEAL